MTLITFCTEDQMFSHLSLRWSLDHIKSCRRTWSSRLTLIVGWMNGTRGKRKEDRWIDRSTDAKITCLISFYQFWWMFIRRFRISIGQTDTEGSVLDALSSHATLMLLWLREIVRWIRNWCNDPWRHKPKFRKASFLRRLMVWVGQDDTHTLHQWFTEIEEENNNW